MTIIPRDMELRWVDTVPKPAIRARRESVRLGESIEFDLSSDVTPATGRLLEGAGFAVTNPEPLARLTPAAVGRHLIRYSMNGYSTIHWRAPDGAVKIVMNGPLGATDVTRARDFRAEVSGAYFVTVFDEAGNSLSSSPLDVVIPRVSAETVVTVTGIPSDGALTVEPLPSPGATLELIPVSAWVNPAKASLRWSTSRSRSVTLAGTGTSGFSSSDPVGDHGLTLGPGPHTFTLVVESEGARLRWTAAGSRFTVIREGADVAELSGESRDTLVHLGGSYGLRVHQADGTSRELGPVFVTIPEPLRIVRSATVDVTLIATAVGNGTVSGGGVKPFGSLATVSAAGSTGYRLVRWTGDVEGGVTPVQVRMDGDKAVQAEFAPGQYIITASVDPWGSGTVAGAGVFPFQTVANLRATPERFFRFVRWSGAVTGGEVAEPLKVVNDGTAVAHFERQQVRLDITKMGEGGGSVVPVSGRYPAGLAITLQASADERSRFLGWSGDATGLSGTVGLGMEVDQAVTAHFARKLAQNIAFPNPGAQEKGRTVPLGASASSGLAVTYVLVSGSAELRGGQLLVSNLGEIVVRALQPGNDVYLPAEPVEIRFGVVDGPRMHLREEGAEVRLENSEHANPNKIISGGG